MADKTEKNIQKIIDYFGDGRRFSQNDIKVLLNVSSRDTISRVVKILKERGLIDEIKEKRNKFYVIKLDYEQLTEEKFQKFRLMNYIMYSKAANKYKTRYDYDKYEYNIITYLDISNMKYKSLMEQLCNERDLQFDKKFEDEEKQHTYYTYKIISTKYPYRINFGNNINQLDMVDFIDKLEKAPQNLAGYNIIKRLCAKLAVHFKITDELSENKNYLLYGKKLSNIHKIIDNLHEIYKFDYINHAISFNYKDKDGNNTDVIVFVGMILISIEKDRVYFVGKQENDNSISFFRYDSMKNISETGITNNQYNLDEYKTLYDELFSVDNRDCANVKIEFDNISSIKSRLRTLCDNRTNAKMHLENDKIIYIDKIRGLNDFANYLREFGKSAIAIEPKSLAEKLNNSAERTLKRYYEEN